MIIKIQNSEHNIYLKHSDKLQFLLSPQNTSTKPSSHQEVVSLSQVCAYTSFKSFYFVLRGRKKKTQSNNRNKLQVDRLQHPIHQKLKSKRMKKTRRT